MVTLSIMAAIPSTVIKTDKSRWRRAARWWSSAFSGFFFRASFSGQSRFLAVGASHVLGSAPVLWAEWEGAERWCGDVGGGSRHDPDFCRSLCPAGHWRFSSFIWFWARLPRCSADRHRNRDWTLRLFRSTSQSLRIILMMHTTQSFSRCLLKLCSRLFHYIISTSWSEIKMQQSFVLELKDSGKSLVPLVLHKHKPWQVCPLSCCHSQTVPGGLKMGGVLGFGWADLWIVLLTAPTPLHRLYPPLLLSFI